MRVSSTFLHLQTSYALQFSSASPLAKKKVRVAALWGLVGPPSGDGAPAVALDASSRSSFWRPRAPLASGPSSSSEITSLLINFYPFGTRIFPFSKEKYTFLTKSSDFGPKIPLQNPLREPFRRPLFGSFWPPVPPKKALEPNTFALRSQKSASCTSGEQIFTFSRTCCAKPSGGHTPQLRNTHLFGLHRDDDDFGLIWSLSFGALVLWFCIPSVLGPGMGSLEPLFGPPRPVFAPLKTPSWPLDCVEEGFCTSFFFLLAHSNAYNIVACSKKMRIVPCFLKKGAAFQNKSCKYLFFKSLACPYLFLLQSRVSVTFVFLNLENHKS